jgi:hypothetical protein
MARAFAQPLAQWPNFHPAFSLSKSTQPPLMTSDSRKYIDGEKPDAGPSRAPLRLSVELKHDNRSEKPNPL